jgi:hypothetical protein
MRDYGVALLTAAGAVCCLIPLLAVIVVMVIKWFANLPSKGR